MNEKSKACFDWFLARLSESSTWRGVILVATAGFGITLTPEQGAKVMASGLMLVGIINVFRQGSPTKSQVADALNEIKDAQKP